MNASEAHQTEGATTARLTSHSGPPFCRLAGFQRFIGGLSRPDHAAQRISTWGAGLGGSRSSRRGQGRAASCVGLTRHPR